MHVDVHIILSHLHNQTYHIYTDSMYMYSREWQACYLSTADPGLTYSVCLCIYRERESILEIER